MKLQILTRRIIYLPEVIILEILLRLTAESLLKFKLVCKQWYKLISSPDFRNTHLSYLLRHHPHPQIIFPTEKVNSDATVEFNHLSINNNGFKQIQIQYHLPRDESQYDQVVLESTCNGLLLLRTITYDPSSDYKNFRRAFKRLYVYNPVTRKSIELPLPEHESSMRSCLWSLVYNVSIQKYQIIALCVQGFSCYVFTLQSHDVLGSHWDHLYVPFIGYPVPYQPIICSNNELYWLIQFSDTYHPTVVAMGLVKKEFREIHCPAGLHHLGGIHRHNLFEMEGFLYLTDTISLDEIDVWVLVEDTWSRSYSIDLTSLENDRFFPFVFGFSLFKEGNNIEQEISIMFHNKLFLYNTQSRKQRLAFDGADDTYIVSVFPHVSSLASWE